MLHNSSSKRSIVTCLPTGKSTALGWRVGCSSSDQLTMFQKPRSGNMCKKGYFPIGGCEGKRKKLTGLPFRRNVTNCGSMPQGRKGLIRSPLRSGTAGLTLSDQINNTTLNTLHGVQRRPAHAKPDFNWVSGPRNGTWKRTCGISCLRSLPPMRRLQSSTTQATFTNPSLLRLLRYSVVCLNSITQCNWHDIETMAE